MQQDSRIKYLGVLIDTNLSGKPQIACIVKKIKRSVGILSKLRHYVNIDILNNLCYSLIHPFLTYGIIIRGNTYSTTLQPSYILQKKAVQIMTFSSFYEHSTPLFRLLAIVKLSDLVTFHIALFMHKKHNTSLLSYFDSFFNSVLIVSITTKHKVQQINLITCLELEQITEYLIFTFKDQRCGILLGEI